MKVSQGYPLTKPMAVNTVISGQEDVRRKKTTQDLVKLCLDPMIQLPTFFSVDMSLVPAVGVEHVDVSMLFRKCVHCVQRFGRWRSF